MISLVAPLFLAVKDATSQLAALGPVGPSLTARPSFAGWHRTSPGGRHLVKTSTLASADDVESLSHRYKEPAHEHNRALTSPTITPGASPNGPENPLQPRSQSSTEPGRAATAHVRERAFLGRIETDRSALSVHACERLRVKRRREPRQGRWRRSKAHTATEAPRSQDASSRPRTSPLRLA